MKELVIYYSFGGTTKRLATALAEERGADLYEVDFAKKPSTFRAFTLCPAAMRQKQAKVRPITVNMADYDKITVMGPIWASHPAPPLNNIFSLLPKETPVEIRLVSGGGKSSRDALQDLLRRLGVNVVQIIDIAGGKSAS
ncbi:hypothetical protein LJB76_02220 [Clostridia bacterium OttesenSCG-928-O13]|nr:hypothetical protein [Clostridia bacterium OttesenSCG-928-O13]